MENPKAGPMRASRPRSSPSSPNDDGREDSQRKPSVRKRTKTGCLTCRKRRIKCDEAKPTCKNCIKSRRHCDGYNQRVIFKEPIGSLSAPFSSNPFTVGSTHIIEDALSHHHDGQSSRVPLQAIAPRPPSFDFNQPIHFSFRQESVPFQLPFHAEQPMNMPVFHKVSPGPHLPPVYSQMPNPLLAADIQPQPRRDPHRQRSSSGFSAFVSEEEHVGEGPSAAMVLANTPTLYPHHQQNIVTHLDENNHHDESLIRRFLSENGMGNNELSNIIESRNAISVAPRVASHAYPLATVIQPDDQDEDRSMPDSDDDYQNAQDIVAPAMNFGMQKHGATQVRTFGAYAESWAVSAYLDHPHIPEFWHVGLRDILMHFVNVTGAIITLFEPRAFDPNLSGAEHIAGHALWRSAFPKMALRHPALLQSMLALASLQLAKLQNYTHAAALKHYHLALRRLGKIMQSEMRRKHPATLAATMLLGFFEVWSADHSKWSQHLWGTRILFQEIPLKKMAKLCLPTKRWRQQAQQRRQINSFFPGLTQGLQHNSSVLDYELLSVLTGTVVTPEDYGDMTPQQWDPNSFRASDKDLETFELYSDLFWWYCKMDVYQSFLGGTKLFMEYKHWTQCPPRSNSGTTFGTYDHLLLLLGRLADFAFKDGTRKRKSAESRAGGAANRSPQMFPGMLPVKGRIRGPTGFNLPREASPPSESSEDFDPQASLQNALCEWESIRQAFEVFKNHLGPEYAKLDRGYGDLQDTPFGPAVQYRSYAIAGIWMNYYLGVINLYRSHPEMPPASLQAAGLQAAKTKDYALEIGRIAAGTALDLSEVTEINTLLAAVLIESCFCLFAAGVQFRDAAQRQWMVRRMFDVARLTGWQTAGQIAAGCESAWIKAFELQVGPPYARSTLFKSKSIWDNPRRIDQRIHELAPGEHEPLVLANADRANYALGLLGVEDDLQVLELED